MRCSTRCRRETRGEAAALLLCLLLAGCGSGPQPAQKPAVAPVAAPIRKLSTGHDSPEAEALRLQARRHLEVGETPEAVRILRRCVTQDPRAAGCWNDLGMAQVTLGDRESARKSWQQAAALDPDLTSARYNLAQLASAAEDVEEAMRLLEEVVARAPDEGAAWKALGEAAMEGRDFIRARRAFEAATRLLPGDLAAWQGLAEAHLLSRQYPEARAAAARALVLEPQNTRSRLLQALAAIEDSSQPPDLASLDRDLQALLNTPEFRHDCAYGLGRIRERQGNHVDAALYFRLALRTNPDDLRARYELARSLMAAGRREEGRQEMDAYDRLFRLDTQIAALRLRLQHDPDNKELRRQLKGALASRAARS